MQSTEAEITLLNRILDEVKGLREDFRSLETRHGNLDNRVTRLEEDRSQRDKAGQARTAYVCAFGALLLTAIAGLFSIVYGTENKVESMNNYGTAYGRGKEESYNRRLDELSKAKGVAR